MVKISIYGDEEQNGAPLELLIAIRSRGDKIGPVRWASPVRPKLGPGWVIKFLALKKSGQIWPGPVWPGPARLNFFLP